MEVGWHLRFSREPVIEVLVSPKALPQVEDHVGWTGGWSMKSLDQGDHLLVRLVSQHGKGATSDE